VSPEAAPGRPETAAAARRPAAQPRASLAPDLTPLVPGASPRGAFLMPRVARDLLPPPGLPVGETHGAAQPMELAALDLMAAGAVAGADNAWDAPVAAARAAYARDIDFTYTAGPGGDEAESIPSVRAARALAYAYAASSGTAPWVRAPSQLAGLSAPAATPPAPAQSDVVPHDVGESLRSLVAPPPAVLAPGSVSTTFGGRPQQVTFPPPISAPSSEVVRTGARQASAPSSGTASGYRPTSDFDIPSWFEAAAKKMLAEQGHSEDRFGLPELTLIGAAATSSVTRLAASEEGGSGASAAAAGGGGGGDQKKKDNIEEIAREVYSEIRRIMQAQRLRSGDL